ncbi:MAG: hypothetical protein QOF10_4669, partial [Kribbellaceae bacterium]|nr:hypothetical protein [Kribbellaceae bacterium]
IVSSDRHLLYVTKAITPEPSVG